MKTKFDLDRWVKLRYQAHVCRRCGEDEMADRLEAEAEAMNKAYWEELDKIAGLA